MLMIGTENSDDRVNSAGQQLAEFPVKNFSDIRPQNASDPKHAPGAGRGDSLDVLLHPGGWGQAFHPLENVPQGVDQLF